VSAYTNLDGDEIARVDDDTRAERSVVVLPATRVLVGGPDSESGRRIVLVEVRDGRPVLLAGEGSMIGEAPAAAGAALDGVRTMLVPSEILAQPSTWIRLLRRPARKAPDPDRWTSSVPRD
jgi:hypothetical protein